MIVGGQKYWLPLIGLHAVKLLINSSHGSLGLFQFHLCQRISFSPSFRRAIEILREELPRQGQDAADNR